jgi:hypothetical protein
MRLGNFSFSLRASASYQKPAAMANAKSPAAGNGPQHLSSDGPAKPAGAASNRPASSTASSTSTLVAPPPTQPGSASPDHLHQKMPDFDPDPMGMKSQNRLMMGTMAMQSIPGVLSGIKQLVDVISPPPHQGAQDGAGAAGAATRG